MSMHSILSIKTEYQSLDRENVSTNSEALGQLRERKYVPVQDKSNKLRRFFHLIHPKPVIDLDRAYNFGYEGDNYIEAKKFLKERFQSVEILVKAGYIPRQDVVYKENRWSSLFKTIDSEETLRNIESKRDDLKVLFTRALYECAKKNDLETMQALLVFGVNPNIMDRNKHTPLTLTTSNPEMTELLLDYGANINHQTQCGHTALHIAARDNRLITVHILLLKGAKKNCVNNKGQTPLHVAFWNKTLIRRLADEESVNIPDKNGLSPLMYYSDSPDIMAILCEKGADVNYQTPQGSTPLHHAVLNKHTDSVRLLLKHGADRTIRDEEGKTAYDYAKNSQIKKLLTAHRSQAFKLR